MSSESEDMQDVMQDVALEPVARPTDDQDRVLIQALTDREIAEETLNYLRLFTDLLTQMSQNPMISRMFPMPPGFGK